MRVGGFVWFQKPVTLQERVGFFVRAGLTQARILALLEAEHGRLKVQQAWYPHFHARTGAAV